MNPAPDGSVSTSFTKAASFTVAVVDSPSWAEIKDDEALVLTNEGELEATGSSVVGTADLDGDGRPELVLSSGTSGPSFTVFADTGQGPKKLGVGDRGGAHGWKSVRLAERDGKHVLIAITQTAEPGNGAARRRQTTRLAMRALPRTRVSR
jgi:hypothetical protein